jgi:8-oxo-dGTP pyrophosphatase MutT (NUDIX family)
MSRLGILIGRRIDGKPPWTFIGGGVEPGETPAAAAAREVEEETGLLVHAAELEIGRRIHPVTERTMIYVACYPEDGIDAASTLVGDVDELVEVRWVTYEEARQLLPDMFGPVDAFLRAESQRR